MNDLQDVARLLLGTGLESEDINLLQMGARAAVIYLCTLVIVRVAKKRFMGRATAFDVILGIMMGSVVSRAITGNAPRVPALTAAAVLVAMHWLFSGIAVRWTGFGHLIKGRPDMLIRDGNVDEAALRRAHMTHHDLNEDMRSHGIGGPEAIKEGRLERSGRFSAIKQDAKVIDVTVAEGVQTVRVVIG